MKIKISYYVIIYLSEHCISYNNCTKTIIFAFDTIPFFGNREFSMKYNGLVLLEICRIETRPHQTRSDKNVSQPDQTTPDQIRQKRVATRPDHSRSDQTKMCRIQTRPQQSRLDKNLSHPVQTTADQIRQKCSQSTSSRHCSRCGRAAAALGLTSNRRDYVRIT